MKTLILVRHAKSSWEFNLTDNERPLKKRGVTDAHLVSKAFLKTNINVDFIYSSSATRAMSTCDIFVKNIGFAPDSISGYDQLYDFSGEQVIDFVKKLNNELQTVMIFGHNHAFTSIVNLYGDRYIDNLPTSGLVVLEFDIPSWEKLQKGKTKLILFPRDFK